MDDVAERQAHTVVRSPVARLSGRRAGGRVRQLAFAIATLFGIAACGSPTSVGPLPVIPPEHLPNDHDALTMLASESYLVEEITSTNAPPSVHLVKVLQDTIPGTASSRSYFTTDATGMVESTFSRYSLQGRFVVFVSYDRSTSCLAATFRAQTTTRLQLVRAGTDFGPDAPRGYRLAGRFLSMPSNPSYDQLAQSLYPTGGELDASNTGESWCPGP